MVRGFFAFGGQFSSVGQDVSDELGFMDSISSVFIRMKKGDVPFCHMSTFKYQEKPINDEGTLRKNLLCTGGGEPIGTSIIVKVRTQYYDS